MAANKNARIDAIDVAKGIGMLFVIFAHINYTNAPLTVIYSFHMPLFFVLSGMMFERGKYNSFAQFVRRRFFSLIVPYFIFQLISLSFFFLSEIVFSGFSFDLLRQGTVYIMQVFVSQGSANMFNRPMWFVLCLFAVEIVYYSISSLNKVAIAVVCTVAVVAGWLLESGKLPFDNSILPWSLDSALFSIGFYAIGNIFAQPIKSNITKISQSKHKLWVCLLVAVLSMVAGIPLALLNGKISIGSKDLNNGFLLYLTGLIGTVFILALSILMQKLRIFQFIGKTSFCIMGIHYLFRMVISKLYVMLGIPAYNSLSLVECVVPFVAVTLLSLIFAFAYSKANKMLKGKLKKAA